jgi:hypothetical protein
MNAIISLSVPELIERLRAASLSCEGNRYVLACRLYDHIRANTDDSSSSEDDWDILRAFNYPSIITIVMPINKYNKNIAIPFKTLFYFSNKKRKLLDKPSKQFYTFVKKKRRMKIESYQGDLFAFQTTDTLSWNTLTSMVSSYMNKTVTMSKGYKEVVVIDKRMLVLYF